MTTCLVSGGTGFIGRHLVRRLLAAGETVHLLCRPDSVMPDLPGPVTVHRISDPDALPALLRQVRPRTCFHLATRYQHGHQPGDVAPLLETNVVFGTALADAAVRADCPVFVNAGTASQLDRDGRYAPASLYAASKQAFEDMLTYFARHRGMACRSALMFDTFGPADTRGKILSQLLEAARSGAALDASPGGQEIDLLHVEDAVDGLLAAAATDEAGARRYALSSGRPLTLRALGALIETAAGRPLNVAWGARPYRDGEVMQTWKDGTPPPGWQPCRRLEDFLRAELAG